MSLRNSVYFLVACFTYINGCAVLSGPSSDIDLKHSPVPSRDRVLSAIRTLRTSNSGLQTIKGIGRMTLNHEGKTQYARMAWIASKPNKMRVEVLGTAGQTVFRIAYDGEHLQLDSPLRTFSYQEETRKGDLSDFLDIPIKFSNIIAIMCGALPIDAEDEIVNIRKRRECPGFWISMEKSWFDGGQNVCLDHNLANATILEDINWNGSVAYRAVREDIRQVDGFELPYHIVLTNEDGTIFDLKVERLWTNVSTSQSVFQLATTSSDGIYDPEKNGYCARASTKSVR